MVSRSVRTEMLDVLGASEVLRDEQSLIEAAVMLRVLITTVPATKATKVVDRASSWLSTKEVVEMALFIEYALGQDRFHVPPPRVGPMPVLAALEGALHAQTRWHYGRVRAAKALTTACRAASVSGSARFEQDWMSLWGIRIRNDKVVNFVMMSAELEAAVMRRQGLIWNTPEAGSLFGPNENLESDVALHVTLENSRALARSPLSRIGWLPRRRCVAVSHDVVILWAKGVDVGQAAVHATVLLDSLETRVSR